MVFLYVEQELPGLRYSTQRSYLSVNQWIGPHWGDCLLEELKPVPVEQWLRSLQLAPKSKVHCKTGDDRTRVRPSRRGRSLLRVGKLGISIEGMPLADGEKCSLAAAETYRGEKKSNKRKTGIVMGTMLGAGPPIPWLIHGHGKDVKVSRAGST